MEKKSSARITYIESARGPRYNAAEDRERNFIGSRIAEARGQKRLSLAAFKTRLEAFGVSVSPAAINKWEKGGSAPNAYQLLAISRALGVDKLEYFMSCARPELNEEGQRKMAEYRADLIASGRYKPCAAAPVEYISMPVSSLAVSAGTGEFLDQGNFEMLSFPASTVPEGAEFGVRVSGDSMEPVYHDGQIVWVRPCERLHPGEVGIFIYNGEGYLKVYDEQLPPEGEREEFTDSYGALRPQPVMISYNRAYEPRAVSAYGGFKIVGKVL